MEQAWEEPEAALDRTVDAHIKMLRAKLRLSAAMKIRSARIAASATR
jgi:two-component system catabolic regulation response regulator CreB